MKKESGNTDKPTEAENTSDTGPGSVQIKKRPLPGAASSMFRDLKLLSFP